MTELKKTYTVSRAANCLRHYVAVGREIGSIKIYNESGVIYETNCGWFKFNSLEDVTSIELSKEVKRANKVNFNRKDNYIVKDDSDQYYIKYCLYLHESEFESIKYFQKVVIDNADYTQRANFSELTFKHEFTYKKYNYNKEAKKSYYTDEKARTLTQLNGYYLPRELKDHGKQKKRIREKLENMLHVNYISDSDIEQFMKEFKEIDEA